jgi:HK97 family phage portal protein
MRNIFKALFAAPQAKASRTAHLIALESGGRARWTPRDYAALAREGYMTNAIVHRAVKLVAESAASVPYLAYEGDAAREPHPLTALLAKPNPRQERAAFLEAVCAHLLLAGNAYIEAVTLDGVVRELYALRPDRMRVAPGPDGWPEAYEYAVAGRTLRFEQNAPNPVSTVPPILHLAQFHPLDDHYGLSSIEPAAVAIDIHNAAAKWNKALLDNAARP